MLLPQSKIFDTSTHIFLPPGLKSGDEVLLLNGKPASALQMDDMKAAFVNQALTLSISTVPELDPQVLCCHPPRRSDWEQDPATDIFSQSQGEAFCRVERMPHAAKIVLV